MKLINYILIATASFTSVACTSNDVLEYVLEASTTTTKANDLETFEVKLEKAGTLAEKLGDKKDTVQKLILSGLVDADDVNTFRSMAELIVLDMKAVEFVESEKTYDSYYLDITGPRPTNYKVKRNEISPWMFSGAKFKPESVILPDDIISIGEYAFRKTPLKSINIPEGVKEIATGVFSDSKLQSLNIPETVNEIGTAAFQNCMELKSITIPNGVTAIKGRTFMGCEKLSDISIPESVTEIYERAFMGCKSLQNIALPEHLNSIDLNCFSNSGLVTIKIPDSVTKIGTSGNEDGAFTFCRNLISVTLSQGMKIVPMYTFVGCNALKHVVIPSSITTIEHYAFRGCSSLSDITFSEGLTSISSRAFSGCSLKEIVFPESLTSIGEYAFENNGTTNICLPSKLKNIGKAAFSGCDLRSVIIPGSVSSTGDGLFAYNNSLNSIFWNTTAAFPDIFYFVEEYYGHDVTYGGGNLNCLIYLSDGNTPLSSKRLKNIIIDGVADQIELSSETGSFNCPQEFKALKISYTKEFSAPTYPKESAGWNSISLPFTPTQIKQADGKMLAPFGSDIGGVKNFWLRRLTAKGFENAVSIEANRPYIIAMPNNKNYAAEYNITGKVIFNAEDAINGVTIPTTTTLPKEEGPSFMFCSNYEQIPKNAKTYVLNEDNINRKAGSVFVRSERDALPFEAYVTTKNMTTKAPAMFSISSNIPTRSIHVISSKPSIDDI